MRNLRKTIILAALLAVGCTHREKEHCILPADVSLKQGDIVFRLGCGMSSRAVTQADGGSLYSHVGIVADSAGIPVIVHAVPYEDGADRVKMERPEEFYSSIKAMNGAVCRTADTTAARRAAAEALRICRRGTPFNHAYDDEDTLRMYCCQLVTSAYYKAGVTLTKGPGHTVRLPWLWIDDCTFPSDIWKSSALTVVREF